MGGGRGQVRRAPSPGRHPGFPGRGYNSKSSAKSSRSLPSSRRRAENGMYEFAPGAGLVPAHRHRNPDGSIGGLVADSAKVARTAHVDKDARVSGHARVEDNAKILDEAAVYDQARVHDDAVVSGKVQVYGRAVVCDRAQVSGEALVAGESFVHGGAVVLGKTALYSEDVSGLCNLNNHHGLPNYNNDPNYQAVDDVDPSGDFEYEVRPGLPSEVDGGDGAGLQLDELPPITF